MPRLADTFRSSESRMNRAIVVVDLANSTNMKEKEPEASWLTTYGWFFDQLEATVGEYNGRIVKYLGDGVFAVFGEDNAADAINWAIRVQEETAQAQAENRVSCDCSIGVSYGEVVEFETVEGSKDYIGSVVDKAFRLCSAANAKAVFVETNAISAAAMNRVRSKLGVNSVPRRTAAEYQGPEESVRAKGFSLPIPYHEILWTSTRYGVAGDFVTKLSSQEASARETRDKSVPAAAAQWARGIVTTLNDRFGFIRSGDGEDFFFNESYLFRKNLPVQLNSTVWFIPAEALPNTQSRRATNVMPFGALLDGKLERVMPEGFGFALCSSDRGETKQIFVYLGDSGGWEPGMRINFTVSENRKGITGVEPVKG